MIKTRLNTLMIFVAKYLPDLSWSESTSMRLRKFLLRYYPPGIILEYEQNGEVRAEFFLP